MLITFGEILNIGIKRLEQAEIPDAKRDAESLLLFMAGETRNFLFLHKNDGTDESHADAYFEYVDRRASGEPLQYIVGSQEFMGLEFEVNESVLIPRQDTETLVELAVEMAKEKKPGISILDMCCGSGAISVSMAHFLPKAKVLACDISEEALQMAKKNIEKNGVEKRVTTMKTDMFEVEKRKKKVEMKDKFDMILSNPPYIPSEVIGTLQTEVKDHEPIMALDGGEDGLDFYRIIVRDAGRHLKKQGILIMEIGHDQAQDVVGLLEESGQYEKIEVHRDLPGLDRVVSCQII